MSLQSIINISNQLNFNRRKLVGIQYARNELPRVSETPTYNPWKLTVTAPSNLRYSEARAILEKLDQLDRRSPEVVSFNDNPKLSWLLAYQGELNQFQQGLISVVSFVGNQLVLDVSALSITSTTVILQPNDFIQIQGYPYPFTSTGTVYRGTNSTITVTTHRPNIITDPVTNLYLNWGNDVEFRVFCPNMPTYTLTPGGAIISNGTIINNALIEFSDSFELYEYVSLA